MRWNIGELDERITLQREVRTSDGMGGYSTALIDVATVWAKVIARSGRERAYADRLNAEGAYTFVIRVRSDLLESDRILWDGSQYNIRAIARQGSRDMYLEIDAERGVAQ